MVKEILVEGFDDLQTKLKEFEGSSHSVYVLYTGSLGADGKSWCPDCVVAPVDVCTFTDPVIEKGLTALSNSTVFIRCRVGARDFWKDQSNPFRTKLQVTCVPTLVKLGPTKRKLEEAQCADSTLVEMLFEDE